MPSYSRPRLIDENDRQYQLFLKQIMLQRDNQRAMRPPRARDLFGGEAEAILRQWLAERLPLSPQRIVEYEQRKGRSQIKKYRELDAITLVSPRAAHVFEMKATRRASSLRRAMRQLRETQAILQLLLPQVSLTVLLVDTGIPTAADVQALLADPETPADIRSGLVPPPETLDEVLATLPDMRLITSLNEHSPDSQQITLLRFSVADIVALAGEEQLHLDWPDDDDSDGDDVSGPSEPPPPLYTSSSDDTDDENPLAAALRKAMDKQREDE